MAQRSRDLQPELSPIHLFGARLRLLREAAGVSQTELGRRVAYSGHQIGKIELGLRRPSPDLVRALDDILLAGGQLKGLAARFDIGTADRAQDDMAGVLGGIRRCLDLRDDPADGPVRPIADLGRDVERLVRMRLDSGYQQLAAELLLLLPELHRAWLSSHDRQIAGFLVQVYRAADAIADKTGQHDLSARIIDMLRVSAADSGDPVTIAVGEYVRGELFFVSRDWLTGSYLLDRAATTIGRLGHSSPRAAAAAGALQMRAAVLAARGGDRTAADGHLHIAAGWTQRAPEGIYAGTAFGAGSVRIHQLSLALDADDVPTALAVGANWAPPPQVPAERRSHFYLDWSTAQQRVGNPEAAVAALLTARQVAPQHMRSHPQMRAVLTRLVAANRRPSPQLAQMCRWVGMPVS